MAFVRNVAFPAVGNLLRLSGLTRRGIETREVRVYADGIANRVIDIIADMHIWGVHKNINPTLQRSQSEADRIIWDTQCVTLNLGDIMTLGSWEHKPTGFEHVQDLEMYFSDNAKRSEGGKIWSIDGNHDRRMLEKISPKNLEGLRRLIGDLGFDYIDKPIEIWGDKIKLHSMPCHNTQKELYTPEAVRELLSNINSHSGVNIVMVHNPDGVRQIEAMKAQLWLRINVPTLFLCGHTHGLLGFQDIPIVGEKLSRWARKWIGMESDSQYISGYYPATTGEPYGIFVSRGMGDQADIFRVLWGGRERPILRFVERKEDADIILGN